MGQGARNQLRQKLEALDVANREATTRLAAEGAGAGAAAAHLRALLAQVEAVRPWLAADIATTVELLLAQRGE